MIVYLDTSCLVKLVVDEPGSEKVLAHVSAADALVTSVLSYPEAMSALARRKREGYFSGRAYGAGVRQLKRLWGETASTMVTNEIAELAGRLVEKHRLKGGDGVHLATSLFIRNEARVPNGDFWFLCADDKLNKAAEAERFQTVDGWKDENSDGQMLGVAGSAKVMKRLRRKHNR